jgi:hypothetical protein
LSPHWKSALIAQKESQPNCDWELSMYRRYFKAVNLDMVAMKVGMDNGKTTKIQGQNTER